MIDSVTRRDPVELLADEFAARRRKGECPSIVDYMTEYPHHAEQIEQLFPAVMLMEQLRLEEDSQRHRASRRFQAFVFPRRIGDFEIVREIGRGGMGVVYEAEQRSLGRRVALKVLPENVLIGDKRLERFQREAQTAAKLRHTAIVPVFGVGEQDGLHYYVMPLVRGVGLDKIIAALRSGNVPNATPAPDLSAAPPEQAMGPLIRALTAKHFPRTRPGANIQRSQSLRRQAEADRWNTAAHLGLQAAEALEYAHGQGTLHRDIKPANLLVDEDGNACLADFGLARAIESPQAGHDLQKEVVGTPRYMAPEQSCGIADARSDIYGLGRTLYELLTLHLPACSRPAGWRPSDRCATNHREPAPSSRLPGRMAQWIDRYALKWRHPLPHAVEKAGRATIHEWFRRQGPSRPTSPRVVDPTIPRDLEAIVLKCVAHDPVHRYQTAGALAADLRCFLEDRPIRARRASRFERAYRWCRRNPALAGVSAMAMWLLLAFAATALVGYARTRTAYAETRRALARAEATSGVALEVLENLYLQLAPERLWIPSDSDPPGQACACIGLRSARPAAPDQREYIQVQPSEQTAALLQNLLVFYDRLAEQVGDDQRVMLQSAIATRRVGDIRQRLGQIDQAEREYLQAISKLAALGNVAEPDARVFTELARVHNEIGNVRSARLESYAAYQAHREALRALQTAPTAQPPPEEYRYELARTYFFLASRHPGHIVSRRSQRRGVPEECQPLLTLPEEEYRRQAIALLEELSHEAPHAADYRFLLALCYRPLTTVFDAPSMSNPTIQGSAAQAADSPFEKLSHRGHRAALVATGDAGVLGPRVAEPLPRPVAHSGRQRALEILESLKNQYPQVADYRYELAATYAWVHVGLFPWQGHTIAPMKTEHALHKALDEAQWLAENNPTIPHFARIKALILAKLGTVSAEAGHTSKATDWFRQSLHAQAALVEQFPDIPSHDRVLLEFFRFRLATLYLRAVDSTAGNQSAEAEALLKACVSNLTALRGQHNLDGDRLAASSLRLAQRMLRKIPGR